MTEWNITSSHRHVQFACPDRDAASRAHAIIPTDRQTNKQTNERTNVHIRTYIMQINNNSAWVTIIVGLVLVVDIITTTRTYVRP